MMLLDFRPDSLLELELVRDEIDYWNFFLFKITHNGRRIPIEFRLDKKTLFPIKTTEKSTSRATKEDFDLLMSYQEGREIIEQLKIYDKEIEKFKYESVENLSIISEEKIRKDSTSYLIDISVKNSPLILRCIYGLNTGVFTMNFHLATIYKLNSFLTLPLEDKRMYKNLVRETIQKKSKQRLRILTKNVNLN